MADTVLPVPSSVKRACDGCHRRKVKCIGDGTRPCKNCTSAGLTCTYNAIPQKKGPKGSRAKVISELRETQRQSQLVAKRHGLDFEHETHHAQAYPRKPGLLSMDMITTCVDYYFANIYPTQPILHRQKVGETIGQMDTNIEAYCLVLSLCAYMMIQPNMVLPHGAFEGLDILPQPSLQLGHLLLQEALRMRKEYNYIETPTVWSVITSFFFFGSYFCLDRQNTAWFHLREATTLAQVMGMHEEASYQNPDVVESSRRRRLYWLLFVTERAYALQQHKPLTLHATINLPTLDEDPAETVELNGFIHLVRLFRPFDDTFVGLWNKARVGCTTEWLARLQQQLSDALPTYLQCTETQAVDLRCSQQWLRTMVWQLSISHGFLSSAAADNAMSFKFPIEVSRDLVQSASQFSQQSMEVHGIGLIEKLFDVACTLTDVMSVIPQDQYTFELGPRDYLNQLTSLISTLRGGQQRYLPLLMQKISDAVPDHQTPAFTIPAIPRSIRSEEIYDGSHSSAPNSGESTPAFGSPLGSPLSVGVNPYNSYPDMGVTSAVQYGPPPPAAAYSMTSAPTTVPGPQAMYGMPNPAVTRGPVPKYDSAG
ncbi:c6 zinc finger domain containing protein [Zymoseptoria brevis]|uniref:C6 zinc finger domain containing protein n=1 Tax=Zymoseptoria brevis TaxID=1047168 RepID=A0A0F4G925_9PEZI|nr:c6 zinc finger domain containing protein [Zymoseptoria brevis]